MMTLATLWYFVLRLEDWEWGKRVGLKVKRPGFTPKVLPIPQASVLTCVSEGLD